MSVHVEAAALNRRVDQLITAQAQRTPQATAAVCAGESLSYAELERRCDALACHLRAMGAQRGKLVGIHLERSLDMLVSVIAVMKSGAAYVPLDPEFPAQRLAHMVADAGLALVVSHSALRPQAPPGDYRRLDIDQLGSSAAAFGAPEDPTPAGAADLVYVLYTSGSTGKPKGVALEHRNVVNFLLSMQQEPGLRASDRLVAVTTLSFDIAGLELYLPLVTGATVVIASRDEAMDGERLRMLIEAHDATAMQATPTTWRVLIEAGWQGSPGFKLLCGGEALPADLARLLVSRGALWNMYGPTETAIWSTCYRVPESGAPVLIGRPIANTRVYVVDKAGRPAPTGVPGELCIAGAGVARGYLNRPELNAERFVADPFDATPGARMYRTGDMGRYLSDGNLEFRQRADSQVKIRGFRVELGDVEAALDAHPAVRQSVARVVELRPGDARLVAYVLAPDANPPSAAELREHLQASVPQYMIPQHFIIVAQFPLTPNGKVDRAQLPSPQASDWLTETYVEPATDSERTVARVFRDVLTVERVGAEASFFDLGGHSVLATRVVAQLRKLGHADVTLRMLFESATVAVLARELDRIAQAAPEREAYEF